jgi:DNA invertase Pin-like site-specific DNA recombinase
MIFGYIRVSTAAQDKENQRHSILEYANKNKLTPVNFVEEVISSRIKLQQRRIWELIENMQPGDILITSEISRIGRSVSEIMQIFQILVEKNITTHIIKGGYTIGGGENKIQSTVLIFAFGLAAEIERELISQRTREALAKKKKEGIKLGRPPGKAEKVMLDEHKEKIIDLLNKGMSKSDIAKIFSCHRNTIISFLKRNDLKQYIKKR